MCQETTEESSNFIRETVIKHLNEANTRARDTKHASLMETVLHAVGQIGRSVHGPVAYSWTIGWMSDWYRTHLGPCSDNKVHCRSRDAFFVFLNILQIIWGRYVADNSLCFAGEDLCPSQPSGRCCCTSTGMTTYSVIITASNELCNMAQSQANWRSCGSSQAKEAILMDYQVMCWPAYRTKMALRISEL